MFLLYKDPPKKTSPAGSTPFRQATYLRPLENKCFLTPFWIDFWWIFLPNLAPKIHQNWPKIDVKMPSQVDSVFLWIFDRFWLPTWLSKTIKIHQKSMPRGTPSWTSIFDRLLIDFCHASSVVSSWLLQRFSEIGVELEDFKTHAGMMQKLQKSETKIVRLSLIDS